MKKTVYILAFALLPALMLPAGCTKDKGSYDYREIVTAEIGALPSRLAVERFSNIRIEPQIVFSDPSITFDEFDYIWFTDPDTYYGDYKLLSQERILDVQITSTIGDHYLGFRVINKETGVYNDAATSFMVTNENGVGYMLLSSINGDAELTFVSENGKIIRDVFETVNGYKIGKNPLKLHLSQNTYQGNYFVWILCDDAAAGGGVVLDPLTFNMFRRYEDMFMFKPDRIKPQVVASEGAVMMYEVTVNDGVLYSRQDAYYSLTEPIEFTVPVGGNYYVDDFIFCWGLGYFFAYDKIGQRFLRYNHAQSLVYQDISDPGEGAAFDPRDVGMDMLAGYMCGTTDAKYAGRTIMKDSNGDVHLLSFVATEVSMNGDIVPDRIFNVGDHIGINQANVFAIKSEGEFAYYSIDNQIHMSSFLTGLYRGVMYDQMPAGLTIDCMRVDRKFGRNELWVAASNGSESADSGSFFIFDVSSDGTLTKKAEYLNCCGKVVDILFKHR